MPKDFALYDRAAGTTVTERDPSLAAVRQAQRFADWMDTRFRIPGMRRRLGLDALLGLVPGIGDVLSLALSSYLIGQAWRYNLPKRVLLRMGWNVLLDTAIGTVPLVGDLFDVAWRANQKNAALLARHLEAGGGQHTRRLA